MKLFANDASLRAASNQEKLKMRTLPWFAVLTALFVGLGHSVLAAEQDGVALAIVYDTSGSMKDPVQDKAGHSSPKYVIANHALIAIAKRIQTFATNNAGAAPRKIEAGLFVFNSKSGAREAVKFGAFDPEALQRFARDFSNPSGNTPLGNSLKTAGETVLASPLSRKHVLIITDGQNTVGPQPSLAVHFVAFDVDAHLFDPVKKQGATVVSAADETQLNSQLEYILQRKILLEDEEPKK
jgi:von Willebrand factor type A domain